MAQKSSPQRQRTLLLKPRSGYLNVDVLDGKIVELEILFRDEIRKQVLDLLP